VIPLDRSFPIYCSSFGARKSSPTNKTFLFDNAIDKDRLTAVNDFPSFATEEVTKINFGPFLFFRIKSTLVLKVLNASEIAVLLPLDITIC